MPIIYDPVNKNAHSGTELMMRALEQRIDPKLLEPYNVGRAIMLFKDPTKTKIYWTHNLPGQMNIQEVSEAFALRQDNRWKYVDQIVFVSEWQKQQYIDHFKFTKEDEHRFKVLRNAITPIPEHTKPTGTIRLIYMSVPERGLAMLYDAFEQLAPKYDIELEIFSSYKIYGIPNADRQYHQLFEKLKSHPQIKYHGTVSNDEIHQALQRSHIFAYPSTFKETSCISLLEAMSAGCLCVHPNIAAMAETAAGYTNIYEFNPNRHEHRLAFQEQLEAAILQWQSGDLSHLSKQKEFVDQNYSWDVRIKEWEEYLSRPPINNVNNSSISKEDKNMKIDRALIIRRQKIKDSMEYADQCAKGCEEHGIPYEFIDGIEFMSSEDAMKTVGVWLHPDNVKKRVSQGNNNCHASHIKCWRRIIEIGKPCVIFEHDVIVKGNVCNIDIEDMAINIFGHRINDPSRYNPVGPIEKMVKIPQSIGGHAYGITPAMAQWLVNDAEQNGVNINVDEWINYRCGFPLYLTEPPQVVCWPRMSTREWTSEDRPHATPGSTTTFASSNTPGYLAGYIPLTL